MVWEKNEQKSHVMSQVEESYRTNGNLQNLKLKKKTKTKKPHENLSMYIKKKQ